MQKYVIDTSVFMERLDIVNLIAEEEIIFPIVVADELNNLKDNKNSDKSYKARKAIKYITDNSSDWLCSVPVFGEDNDEKIISVAKEQEATLVTLDLGMVLRAELLDVDVYNIQEDSGKYTGYKTIQLNTDNENDMNLLAQYYANKNYNIFDCEVNEYIIIKENNNTVDLAMWNGYTYVGLTHDKSKTVKPKTDEQALAIDLLLNKDITIKTLYGSAGSGKTFLATKLALQMLDSNDYPYEKLLLVRNPLGSGEKIGFLKGDKDDKIQSFFNPFVQHFNGDFFQFNSLVQSGRVQIEVPFFMKGLDLQNTLVIFDESEDSDSQIIKLIGSRLGEGSAIIFIGDSSQAEGKFGKTTNGLELLVQRAKGNKQFGCVHLTEDLRSEASKMFVELF